MRIAVQGTQWPEFGAMCDDLSHLAEAALSQLNGFAMVAYPFVVLREGKLGGDLCEVILGLRQRFACLRG